ncbi:MAG: hypothetical protein CL578_05825 [Alteromonadaceae bacterium]|uniref:Uncharacterized protein n=1 Tax=Paraglaciecola agarilytica NO2 TaxID=1125747 RepID=A0ABQ0I221_9ALTE|nr:hypothetical protein [Paraglaciecola agarilytica]MBN24550.1 hypothetical protein [Alteromonadaceae bacterium]GAC03356.1 hypothetical protein GAGA_0491 [Paraglaciecola agarilytica NO2]|tara:strand:- start:17141 stop:17587 length:447 start_codon:yes stop_codon:yes gene_type:complete
MNNSLFNESGMYFSDFKGLQRCCFRGMKVRVYRNLNKPEYYSILALEGPDKRKVVGYAKSVEMTEVKFIVSAKSRERVLREKSRNVHAFCEGFLSNIFDKQVVFSAPTIEVSYNPYFESYFFRTDDKSEVEPFAKSLTLQHSCAYIDG